MVRLTILQTMHSVALKLQRWNTNVSPVFFCSAGSPGSLCVFAHIARKEGEFLIQKLLQPSSPGSPAGEAPYQDVAKGIAQEELKGLSYMFWGRLAALAVLAVWALTLPFERSAGYLTALAAFLMLDAVILTYVLVVPPPFYVEGWTAQLNLRLPNFLYLGIFLVGMSLSYSPWLVMWAGIAATVAWSAGFLWVLSLPDTVLTTSRQSFDIGLSSETVISRFLDPRSVSLTIFLNQIVFLGLVTLVLARAPHPPCRHKPDSQRRPGRRRAVARP